MVVAEKTSTKDLQAELDELFAKVTELERERKANPEAIKAAILSGDDQELGRLTMRAQELPRELFAAEARAQSMRIELAEARIEEADDLKARMEAERAEMVARRERELAAWEEYELAYKDGLRGPGLARKNLEREHRTMDALLMRPVS